MIFSNFFLVILLLFLTTSYQPVAKVIVYIKINKNFTTELYLTNYNKIMDNGYKNNQYDFYIYSFFILYIIIVFIL